MRSSLRICVPARRETAPEQHDNGRPGR